ncbi:MAG: AAA family ATPase [Thalassovita sp.]
MRDSFVETENYRRFIDLLKSIDERGAEESCIAIVDGKPGLGKTTTLRRWASQTTEGVYLRALPGWDYSTLLTDLLRAMDVDEYIHKKAAKYERIIADLKMRKVNADMAGVPFALVIDECDLISRRAEIMETIRAISDTIFLPTILIGMGNLRNDLRRFDQISSRAPHRTEFKPLEIEDTAALINKKCEVPVANDLIQFAHGACKGFSREVLDAVKSIERFGLRFDYDAGGVTMADMAGMHLVNDRASGKSIKVPGGRR